MSYELYDMWWRLGQFVLKLLWRLPVSAHRRTLAWTGWRISKRSSPIDGELLGYCVAREWPPELFLDNYEDRMGNKIPDKPFDFVEHLSQLLERMEKFNEKAGTSQWFV